MDVDWIMPFYGRNNHPLEGFHRIALNRFTKSGH